ncbi:MAG TPA: hypothetical protein VMI54_27890 [Polyangiaceae bacterium]|nr:hypothetical protein [Polyangiaceae bacterium]
MSGTDFSPVEVGGEGGGFRVTGTPHAALRVEAWGYWPPDVVTAFARDASAAAQRLTSSAMFTLDATNLKPQGAEGQEALRAVLRSLAPLTFGKGVVLASNVLTSMQIARLVRECKLDGRLVFE